MISRFWVRVPGGALAGNLGSTWPSGLSVALSLEPKLGHDAPRHAPKTPVTCRDLRRTARISAERSAPLVYELLALSAREQDVVAHVRRPHHPPERSPRGLLSHRVLFQNSADAGSSVCRTFSMASALRSRTTCRVLDPSMSHLNGTRAQARSASTRQFRRL